jgi:NAD(P)-dependent dehydrogenase (short-subunit alcohol dehydrogenase family)
MCKAALDRLTTGLAAEVQSAGVNVNALGTSGLVMTPGAAAVSPHTPENTTVEPESAMAEAAVILCTGAPGEATGRIAYSLDLLGRPVPGGAWAVTATF